MMADANSDGEKLLDLLPDPIARVDRNYRHLYVNRQWCQESGISREACVGKTFRELGFPPELCDTLEGACERVAAERKPHEFEHPFAGPNGVGRYATRLAPEFDAAGGVVAFLASIRNITTRVSVEAALAESESRFRAFMDHGPGVAWMKDADGRYVYINQGYEQRFNVRLEDWLGKTDAEVWPPEIARTFRENDLIVLADGKTRRVVEEVPNTDGSPGYWLNFKFLIRAAGQLFVGGSGIDITESKLAERTLQHSDLSLRALLDTSAFVIVCMSPDYKVLEWNRAAERIYGYTRAEVLGNDYLVHFLPEEVRAGVAEEIRLLLAGRPTVAYPNDVLHRDGSRRTLLWNACRLIDENQQIRGLIAIGQDITDRIHTEQALRDSEAKYRQLLENIHDVVWSVDVADDPYRSRTTFISDQAEKIFGYTREEFQRDEGVWVRGLHPEDWPNVQDGMRRMLRGAAYHHRAYRFRHGQTGEWRWIEDHVSAQHDAAGKLISLFGVARDISDRVRVEAALRENEERLELALDASHAATWSWDVASNVSIWDRRYYEHYELNPELPPSFESWMEKVHPDDHERLLTRIQAMLAPDGGDIWNEEFRTVPLSWGVRWMAGLGRVARDAAGRAVRFSGLNLDITDRKQTELAARQSADDVQALLDAFPDLYFWIDADGTIRRYHANAPTYVPPEQFLNRRMQDVIPAEIGRQLMQRVDKALETRTIQEAEYSLPEPGGARWYDARYVPLPNSQSLLVVIRDVTARRAAEEEGRRLQAQLQHSQKLESLGVLAGGIAHDFNNILTSMMGFTDLALAELPPDSSLRPHLESVMLSARRAAELTQQMLAYSGKGHFTVAAVNLNDLIQELGSLLRVSISKKASIRYHLAPVLPSVMADPVQLRQIVMNLIINASDALGERDGQITVATSARQFTRRELASTYLDEQLPDGAYVALDVTDTGVGMDRETCIKIFDPFFTTKSAGRGLGLAAVLGIIRGHRGAIQVCSEPGKGTVFRVLLPVAAAAAAATVREVEPPRERMQGTVLVVDDEESVRELARTMLERAGFTVLTAPDGQAALRVYQQHAAQIVLVLLDLTMPLMSGEETLRELRRLAPAVRVILSSGYNEHSAGGDVPPQGLAGFLQKPYRYRDLLETVAAALVP